MKKVNEAGSPIYTIWVCAPRGESPFWNDSTHEWERVLKVAEVYTLRAALQMEKLVRAEYTPKGFHVSVDWGL